jgi:arabinofuranosyltransferase
MIKTREQIQIVVFTWSLALAAWIFYLNRLFYNDDAYITLRYARNFLQGNGIVWNTGEYVQGYTNFLHLMFVALLGFTGIDLFWASRIVGVSAFWGLAGFLVHYCRTTRSTTQDTLYYLPALMVLTSCPIIVWSIGGLEAVLFSLLATAGCLLFLCRSDHRNKQILYLAGSGTCLGLCALTRPDGALFIVISIIWLAITQRGRRLSSIFAFAIPCAIVLAPYALWQSYYYGSVVPNTYYVKVGSFSVETVAKGIDYIIRYAVSPPYIPCLLLVVAIWLTAARRWNGTLFYLAFSIGGYLAFITYVGGDHFQAFRMLVPIIPLMSYAFYLGLSRISGADNKGWHWAVVVSILCLSTVQLFSSVLNPRWEDAASYNGTIVGRYIAKNWPAGSLVALNTAGSTPYYAGQNTYIDMLGLNDAHISRRRVETIDLPWQELPGHGKGDGLYVLSRKPDYIIVGPSEGTEIGKPWFLSDLEMGLSQDFYRNYEMVQIHLNPRGDELKRGGLVFTYYKRKGK